MVATNFEGLVGYRTLRDEGQAPLKAYDCVFGRPLFVLHIWHVRAIPIYRVYQLCDKYMVMCTELTVLLVIYVHHEESVKPPIETGCCVLCNANSTTCYIMRNL